MQIKWYSMRLLLGFPLFFRLFWHTQNFLKYPPIADLISYYRNPNPNTKSIVYIVILVTEIITDEISEILMDILTCKKREVIIFHHEMTKLEQNIIIGAFVGKMR